MATRTKKKLKVGILIDSWFVSAWEYRILEIIQASNYGEVTLAVLNDLPPTPDTLQNRLKENRRVFLWRLFNRLERAVCKPKPDAFEKKDVRELLPDLEVIKARPRQTKFSDFFSDEESEAVQSHGPDVLIRMGFRLIKGGILRAAKHGIWSFHHGDNFTLRGAPSGFWEVFEGRDVVGSILQVLDESIDNGLVLARSWSSTTKYSVRNTRNKYFWKSLSMLPRKLEELHRLGSKAFHERAKEENPELFLYDHRMYRAPGNGEFLKAFIPYAWRCAAGLTRQALCGDHWMLLYRLNKKPELSTSFHRFKKIVSPRDRFWADPFVVYENERYYIFFEEWLHDPGTKGHICVMEMAPDGTLSEPVKVLEDWYHFAYPLVFKHRGRYYMIPDSAQNGTVDIYRAENFPTEWAPHKTIMKGLHLVDPTLFKHGDRWWLFGNVKEQQGAAYSDELFLYHADSPFSTDWTPHPLNPIVSDARKARPAGQVIEQDGKLYRLSQDCSHGYGYGVNLHEILELTETTYRERDVCTAHPNWDPRLKGVHTLNHAEHLTVIDAKFNRLRFGA